jgi:hypothetical protein
MCSSITRDLCIAGVLIVGPLSQAAVASDACSRQAQPVRRSVIAVIDRTVVPAEGHGKWITETLERFAEKEGVEIRIASFAGAIGHDGVRLGEPIMRPPLVSSDCLRTKFRSEAAQIRKAAQEHIESNRKKIRAHVEQALGTGASTSRTSDIAAALSIVGEAFGTMEEASRGSMLIYSDGWEANASQNFYTNRAPRVIDVTREVNSFTRREIPRNLAGVDVVWVGLGTSQSASDSTVLWPLQKYWTQVAALMGARRISVSASLMLSTEQILREPEQQSAGVVRTGRTL